MTAKLGPVSEERDADAATNPDVIPVRRPPPPSEPSAVGGAGEGPARRPADRSSSQPVQEASTATEGTDTASTESRAAPPRGEDGSPGDSAPLEARVGEVVTDLAAGLRRAFVTGGWPRVTGAALFGFAAIVVAGAVFVGVLKLYSPNFGAGQSPLWVLTRIVIAGLACLGAPVERAGAAASVLPIGALVFIAWALASAAKSSVASSPATTDRERALEGARIGVVLALICYVAAIAFRIRAGIDVGVQPGAALLLGGFWGALFGALGGLASGGSLRSQLRDRFQGRRGLGAEATAAATTMLVAALVLSFGMVLIFVIVNLATASDVQLTAGDALAIVFLLAAFAPNIAVGALGFAMGAPIDFVAATFDVGFRTDVSVFSGLELYLLPALIIPAIACAIGGYSARRMTHRPDRAVVLLATAAGLFAVAVSSLVYVGGVRVGRAFLGEGSLLVLAPDVAATLFLAFLWAGALGYAGWRLAEAQPTTSSDSISDSPRG